MKRVVFLHKFLSTCISYIVIKVQAMILYIISDLANLGRPKFHIFRPSKSSRANIFFSYRADIAGKRHQQWNNNKLRRPGFLAVLGFGPISPPPACYYRQSIYLP
jgi:hypothetical protein